MMVKKEAEISSGGETDKSFFEAKGGLLEKKKKMWPEMRKTKRA